MRILSILARAHAATVSFEYSSHRHQTKVLYAGIILPLVWILVCFRGKFAFYNSQSECFRAIRSSIHAKRKAMPMPTLRRHHWTITIIIIIIVITLPAFDEQGNKNSGINNFHLKFIYPKQKVNTRIHNQNVYLCLYHVCVMQYWDFLIIFFWLYFNQICVKN